MRYSILAAAAALLVSCGGVVHAERAVPIPASTLEAPEKTMSVAVLAGGCFWGMEAVFENVRGVKSVTSGYAGGAAATATYDQVTDETTGHAESVRIVYDPAQVTFATLLRVYFSVAHDPTQLNRQGPDVGHSYRSAIFPQSRAQTEVARGYIAQLTKAKSFPRPIVTRIESAKFYPAEAYHQDFMRRNPNHGYIQRWDVPKLEAFRAGFPKLAR